MSPLHLERRIFFFHDRLRMSPRTERGEGRAGIAVQKLLVIIDPC